MVTTCQTLTLSFFHQDDMISTGTNKGVIMNCLFIPQNFPGQFRHLVNHFSSSPGNRVVGICQPQAPGIRDGQFAGVLKGVYSPHRGELWGRPSHLHIPLFFLNEQ